MSLRSSSSSIASIEGPIWHRLLQNLNGPGGSTLSLFEDHNGVTNSPPKFSLPSLEKSPSAHSSHGSRPPSQGRPISPSNTSVPPASFLRSRPGSSERSSVEGRDKLLHDFLRQQEQRKYLRSPEKALQQEFERSRWEEFKEKLAIESNAAPPTRDTLTPNLSSGASETMSIKSSSDEDIFGEYSEYVRRNPSRERSRQSPTRVLVIRPVYATNQAPTSTPQAEDQTSTPSLSTLATSGSLSPCSEEHSPPPPAAADTASSALLANPPKTPTFEERAGILQSPLNACHSELLEEVAARTRRELFRLCFWPFRTWHKYTEQRIRARKKATFLFEVWKTYTQLRVLRGWARYTALRRPITKRLVELALRRRARILRICFWALRKNAQKNKRRYHLASQLAAALLRRRVASPKYAAFIAWHTYARGRRACANRAARYFRLAEQDVPPFPPIPTAAAEYPLVDMLQPVYEQFQRKDLLVRKALRHWYLTTVRRIVAKWRVFVDLNKKNRYAILRGNRRLLSIAFRRWRHFVIESVYGLHDRGQAMRHERLLSRQQVVVDTIDNSGTTLAPMHNAARKPPSPGGPETRTRAIRMEHARVLRGAERARLMARLKAAQVILLRKRREVQSRLAERKENDRQRQEEIDAAERDIREFLVAMETEQTQQFEAERDEWAERAAECRHAARELAASKLRRVHWEFSVKLQGWWVRRCFRALAFGVLWRRAVRFHARKSLQRWLALCFRLRRTIRTIVVYASLFYKWYAWRRWREFIEQIARKSQHRGVARQCRRRRELLEKFSVYVAGGGPPGSGLRAVFYRWLEYTQTKRARKRLVELFRLRSAWRMVPSILEELYYNATGSFLRMRGRIMFQLLTGDIAQYREKLIRYEYEGLPSNQQRRANHAEHVQKLQAILAKRKEPTFENKILYLKKRAALEQKLLKEKLRRAGYPDDHVRAVLELRASELYFWMEHCLAFARRLRRRARFAPLNSVRISSSLAAWLFEVKSYGLVKLPARTGSGSQPNAVVDISERPSLPITQRYERHLLFLLRFAKDKGVRAAAAAALSDASIVSSDSVDSYQRLLDRSSNMRSGSGSRVNLAQEAQRRKTPPSGRRTADNNTALDDKVGAL